MHSALKHQGKALYEYARAGVEVARETRRVQIFAIDLVAWDDTTLVLDVRCSKGTYIRTLAEDIGQALGCGDGAGRRHPDHRDSPSPCTGQANSSRPAAFRPSCFRRYR